jgi:hypothetical protein
MKLGITIAIISGVAIDVAANPFYFFSSVAGPLKHSVAVILHGLVIVMNK